MRSSGYSATTSAPGWTAASLTAAVLTPNPLGLMTQATSVEGDSLWTATEAAVTEIRGAGGQPTTIALNVADATAEAFRLDGDGKPMYPQGLTTYAGLQVVTVPALATGEVLIYDRTGVFLIVGSDFAVQPSTDYAPAYVTNSTALRTVGEFTAAVPLAATTIRRLTIA